MKVGNGCDVEIEKSDSNVFEPDGDGNHKSQGWNLSRLSCEPTKKMIFECFHRPKCFSGEPNGWWMIRYPYSHIFSCISQGDMRGNIVCLSLQGSQIGRSTRWVGRWTCWDMDGSGVFFFFSQVISLHIVNEKSPPGDSPLPGSEHQSTSACNSTLVCSFLQDPPGYFERFEIRQMLCHLLSISYPFLVTSWATYCIARPWLLGSSYCRFWSKLRDNDDNRDHHSPSMSV